MSGLTEEQVSNALESFFQTLDREAELTGRKCYIVGPLPVWDEDEDPEYAETEAEKATDAYKEWSKEKKSRDALRTPEALAKIERAWLPSRSKDIENTMKTDFINEFGDFPIMDNTSTSSRVFEKFKRHIQKAKRDAAAGGDRELFLHLWALTMVYKECDYSFHDTDMPEEGQKQLSALANLWKKVLALPAQAVGASTLLCSDALLYFHSSLPVFALRSPCN
eukprot:2465846-Rhodomonas_salina.1